MATKQSRFQEALDVVEALPCDQQLDLIGVIRGRLAENRRDEIAHGRSLRVMETVRLSHGVQSP